MKTIVRNWCTSKKIWSRLGSNIPRDYTQLKRRLTSNSASVFVIQIWILTIPKYMKILEDDQAPYMKKNFLMKPRIQEDSIKWLKVNHGCFQLTHRNKQGNQKNSTHQWITIKYWNSCWKDNLKPSRVKFEMELTIHDLIHNHIESSCLFWCLTYWFSELGFSNWDMAS